MLQMSSVDETLLQYRRNIDGLKLNQIMLQLREAVTVCDLQTERQSDSLRSSAPNY